MYVDVNFILQICLVGLILTKNLFVSEEVCWKSLARNIVKL